MRAFALEYRFRFAVHAVIFLLGFWAPWCVPLGWTRMSTWLVLSSTLSKAGWLTFSAATNVVLIAAIILIALAAWLRTWGAAYVSASIVLSPSMHGPTLLADGPYRRTRNPLYLGTILHAFGLAILMPPSGAIFCVVLIWIFQVRLALAEEPFLASQFGDAYRDYKARVPRFLPAPTPQVPSAGKHPRWLQAVLGEIYMIGVLITYAVFGLNFNATLLTRGVLISLGLWIIVRALLPRPQQPTETPQVRAAQ
ncbi:MAG TPA: isoprenylcysteine carboxylmethyltransferase family protein [Acidobacteriaceae bacterium]|jgi:protein-S-isoprenylcysteine O-methyltransferase Ste14|nr:isoprenylcysteine carboxylmethyltransferase family protein [Acidobacteriaceae bacterium]